MKKEMAEFLKEASENAGNECELHENYSGRGMYGRVTCGVVISSLPQLLSDVIGYVNEQIGEDEDGRLTWDGSTPIPSGESFRTDNMGQDTIVY